MIHGKKVAVIMPSYNVERLLAKTVAEIPRTLVDQVYVINDASTDNTAEVARTLDVTLITHETNKRYGGTQKTGYEHALKDGADIVIMLHGDYQYDPKCIPSILAAFKDEDVDAVFGSRMHSKKSALDGGMHWWRFVANVGLSLLEELIFQLHLTEYHTGYRAYGKRVLHAVPFKKNSNDYAFDAEIIAQIAVGGYRVVEIPIPTKYEEESQSVGFFKCVEYGLRTLQLLAEYVLHRLGIRKSPLLTVVPKLPI